MGLALFMAWLKTVSYFGRDNHRLRPFRRTEAEREAYESAARFWAKIFAVNFAVGVVTGIPLEFQFGTNWARFSNYAGGAGSHTLKAALIWWPIGMALAAVYFIFAYRMFFRSAAKPQLGTD